MAETKKAADEGSVEMVDTTVPTVSNDSSKDELAANLTVKSDVNMHPVGEPDSESEKYPGGPPATNPNRPPYATNRPDVPILTSLATGSGQHTPPPAEEEAGK